MLRTVVLSILFCFVTFSIGLTASTDNKVPDGSHDLLETNPPETFYIEPTQHPTATPNVTTKPTPTPTSTPPPITNATTTPVPVTNSTTTTTTVPPITNSTTSTPKPGPTPTPTPTPSPTPVTNSTTTLSPPTTAVPHPAPSDRKFDAFSFLGGFALGLGLVAIGFLSWKFYLSRQENYYHTL